MKSIFTLLIALAILVSRASADDVAIVVAKSVPIDNISSEELGKIFRCEETDGPNGTKFVIFSRERGAPERDVVLKQIYHMTESAYNRYFMHAVFTGSLTAAPRVVSISAAMKRIAATNPGAVTYILASQVDNSVKVVKIDGMAPGDPKYPLRVTD